MKVAVGQSNAPAWLLAMRRATLLVIAWSLPSSLFGMQAGMILGAMSLLGWGITTRFVGFRRSPLDAAFLALLAAVGLSLLLAPGRVASFRMLTSFWVWLTFYVVYFSLDSERTLRWTVNGVLILSVLAAIFGIYQSYSGHYPMGEYIHPEVQPLLRPAFGAHEVSGRYAAVGLFFSRVTFAHMLLFPFCWLFALLLEPFPVRIRLVLVAGLGLVWTGLTCTWTRAAPVAAVLAALGLLWTRLRPGKVRFIATALAVVIIVASGIALAPGLLARARKTFSGGRDWGRMTIYQTALDLASKRPATGLGFGSFQQEAAPLIDARVAAVRAKRFAGRLTWAHNDLLTFWAECGMVGAFAFCWLFVAYFLAGHRGLRKIPEDNHWLRAFVRGSLAAVGAFLLTSMAHDNFFHGAELAFVLWFTMGASLAAVRQLDG